MMTSSMIDILIPSYVPVLILIKAFSFSQVLFLFLFVALTTLKYKHHFYFNNVCKEQSLIAIFYFGPFISPLNLYQLFLL